MQDVKLGEAGGGIDIIDFSPFLNGTNKQAVADAILESFRKIGFVYLTNHGIPQEKVDDMFAWSKRFFDLPMETKMLAPHPGTGEHPRGYSPPGAEKITQHLYSAADITKARAKPDVKEHFECGREDHPMLPNIWLPDGTLPGFKEACLDFFWTYRDAELNILRALAIGFHLPEDYFVERHVTAENQLRLLRYPSVPVEQLRDDKITRIGPHSDFGSITLLLQDSVGGLEVEDPHAFGKFHTALPVKGALIVNAGDTLMRWSNDSIRSTVHRVRAPPDADCADGMTPDRYSIPYFCSADFTTVIDCIPGTSSEEDPKKYAPITAGDYIMKRLAALY